MRIPTFHLVLTLIIGGVVLAGCGNVRPEKPQRTTRDGATAKTDTATGKTTDEKTDDGKTEGSKAVEVSKTDDPPKETGKKPVHVAQAATKAEKSEGQKEDEKLEPNRSELLLPTGDKSTSLLAVETVTPKRHQINRDYKYEIHVTNISDQSKRNVALANVRVTQLIQQKMTVSESSVQYQRQGPAAAERTPPANHAALRTGENASAVWTLGLLEPGDRAVITVTARGSERGKMLNYLSVQYDPLLRLETEITQSDIRLAKTAPKAVDNCRKIEYTYVLKNDGNEAVKDLSVEDKLDRGLKTAGGDAEAGQEVVTLTCARLEGGAEKKWKVVVEAAKPGTYKSQAVVTWPGTKTTMSNSDEKMSEWKEKSETVATQVRLGKLKIDVQPDHPAQYKRQKLTYSVTLTNQGDAPVDQPEIVATLDKEARRPAGDTETTWKLPTVGPGKTSAPVTITVWSNTPGKLESKFEASFDCDGQKIKDTAALTTVIKPLELVVAVLPSEGRVEQGDSFTCSLQVSNNGASPDRELKLSLTLPEFVSYEGVEDGVQATYDAKTRTAVLGVIKQLEGGESRPVRVRVRAEKAGKGPFTAQLTSEALGGASVMFESDTVTSTAKKPPAKAPIEAPPAKPEKAPAKSDETKGKEKPTDNKEKPAPASSPARPPTPSSKNGEAGKSKPAAADKGKPAAERAEPVEKR